jgi:hypothetical protein
MKEKARFHLAPSSLKEVLAMKKKTTKPKPVMNKKDKSNEALLKAIHTQFKGLEENLTTMQQEVQETLFHMEMRLENLELIVAEIQAELTQQQTQHSSNAHSHHH